MVGGAEDSRAQVSDLFILDLVQLLGLSPIYVHQEPERRPALNHPGVQGNSPGCGWNGGVPGGRAHWGGATSAWVRVRVLAKA